MQFIVLNVRVRNSLPQILLFDMLICPACSEPLPVRATECPNCHTMLGGQPVLSPELSLCPKCGHENLRDARFCNQCATPLVEQATEIEMWIPEEQSPTLVQVLEISSTAEARSEAKASEARLAPEPVQHSQTAHLSAPLANPVPVLVGLGGFAAAICLCVVALFGYSTVRSLLAAPERTPALPEESTREVLVLLTETQPASTKRPTATVFPSRTALATDTRVPTWTSSPRSTSTVVSSSPRGKIVFSCQMNGENYDQICLMNADGTEWRQLTNNNRHNWYASLAPDGQSVVYSSNLTGNYEIYEISVDGGQAVQLTSRIGGKLYAPEISPDGTKIVFTHDDNKVQTVWVMNRDGSNPHRVSPDDGWDPSWTTDGKQILFASLISNGTIQLFTMQANGSNPEQVTQMRGLVGRSDWAPNGEFVATYAGSYGSRSIYLIPLDGLEPIEYVFSPTASAPSFSPDGQWFAFTGYIDQPDDFDGGCEIYVTRLDRTKVIRLTRNTYCDWQPRWGP